MFLSSSLPWTKTFPSISFSFGGLLWRLEGITWIVWLPTVRWDKQCCFALSCICTNSEDILDQDMASLSHSPGCQGPSTGQGTTFHQQAQAQLSFRRHWPCACTGLRSQSWGVETFCSYCQIHVRALALEGDYWAGIQNLQEFRACPAYKEAISILLFV